MIWVGVAIAIIALAVFKRMFGGTNVNTIKEKIHAGAKIVDVRTPEELRSGAYPGAVNIPLQELPRRLNEIPKNGPVIVYCASGIRSASAARILKQAGYAEVLDAGGLSRMPK